MSQSQRTNREECQAGNGSWIMVNGGWMSQSQRTNREECQAQKESHARRNPQPLTLKNTPKNAVQAGQANTRAGNEGQAVTKEHIRF